MLLVMVLLLMRMMLVVLMLMLMVVVLMLGYHAGSQFPALPYFDWHHPLKLPYSTVHDVV
jgi:hypothetical protein